MKKVLVTGAKGQIGTVLRNNLKGFGLFEADLPEVDLRKLSDVEKVVNGKDVVIHLAWNPDKESYLTTDIDLENPLMAFNVYKSALNSGVKRVIMASSVHADSYNLPKNEKEISPYRLPYPRNPYGATKVYIETLGRYFSQGGLEVVCVRFGGVRLDDEPSDSPGSDTRFLSHSDCVNLIKHCLEADSIKDNYAIIHGISDNPGRVHDLSNPVGWHP